MATSKPSAADPLNEGFESSSQDAQSRLQSRIQQSIPIKGLAYTTKTIKEIVEEGELKLPLGVFLPREKGGPVERLTTFTINADVGMGSYNSLLSALENGSSTAKKASEAIAHFLAGKYKGRNQSASLPPVVSSIGGIPIGEIRSLYGNSLEHFFGNMYLADISTLLLATRITINEEEWKDYAVSYKKCPIANCEQSNVADILDISELEIASYGDLKDKPIFHVELQRGFMDGVGGKTRIKNLFLAPQKLGQLYIYDGNNVDEKTLLSALVVGMPESDVLHDKNKPFDSDHFNACHVKDLRVMTEALQYVQPGPKMSLSMRCSCARNEEISHSINWITDLRNFLFYSTQLPADV